MAEIEDLQVELESIICIQKLERLIDLAKYFKLEIDPEVKTKLTAIKLLRNTSTKPKRMNQALHHRNSF